MGPGLVGQAGGGICTVRGYRQRSSLEWRFWNRKVIEGEGERGTRGRQHDGIEEDYVVERVGWLVGRRRKDRVSWQGLGEQEGKEIERHWEEPPTHGI